MKNVLEVKNLTKIYQNGRGIRDISFDILAGDVYGFLGPNGAGKTTVMKIIMGLCRAQKGEVKIFGHDSTTQPERAWQHVGAMIENAVVYEYMSGYKNLLLASRFYKDVTPARIDEVLEMVDLAPFKHEKAAGYSLGMKQRLGLAAALLSKPKFMILDEPTNGLDVEGTVKVREIIIHLAREHQVTFLLSSHLIHEMQMVCNKIGIINNGQVIKEGLVADLLHNEDETLESFFIKQIREGREERAK
ncbi:ABC-2 type transport system ATP-binding protein [Aneurinibacillus soli]|uniref:Putative ABC transporter ATP-binding protein YxlF n=1 Tax=Aneurinibacillus soli TaxID=1500254 RepID=A0A0U4NIJ0_9BACL|nr:ABC transporter ATP-binding protein [Aneurinibacillus soli]PYE62247.1 ABC-2 type transport system ATP-binding protein [Aneurinibacillus soli]BAU28564.1 putative ABC transporter ATP-binding protein YxlF [Aneurinibacillus soli]